MTENQPNSRRGDRRSTWKQDPAAVRSDILRVATEEFARNGLNGARMDEIAAQTKTSKRMIYYYFEDKAALYRAVLEAAYARVREKEGRLNLAGLDPREALAKLAAFTFNHHRTNPDVIRLVMNENIHFGENLAKSDVVKTVNMPAIERLHEVYTRGVNLGHFRPGFTALHLHWQISALAFFNVSNRYSFSLLFDPILFEPEEQKQLEAQVVQSIMRLVLVDADDTSWQHVLSS